MAESKFWRTIAVCLVAGIFYVGHAMHGGPAIDLPDLTTQLEAGDVATATSDNTTAMKIITSSDDGRTINVWSAHTTSSGVHYQGSFQAKPKGK